MKIPASFVALILSGLAATSVASFFGSQRPIVALTGPKIAGDSPIYHCDDTCTDDLLHFKYINLGPNPPERGKNLTITAAGTLDKVIEDGAYVNVEVRYGYIKIWGGNVDLCEQSAGVEGAECPIEAGTKKVTKTVEMPQQIPPGKYKVLAEARLKDGARLACITAEVTFPA